jgi:PadR family transcriptional regulator, regulatory protein PadR
MIRDFFQLASMANPHSRVPHMAPEPRITLSALRVLAVLLADPTGEHYGLELCRAAELPGGTLYPILARFESAGWLTSAWEDIDEAVEGRRRRRYYRLTDSGAERARQILTDHEKTLRPVWRSLPGLS